MIHNVLSAINNKCDCLGRHPEDGIHNNEVMGKLNILHFTYTVSWPSMERRSLRDSKCSNLVNQLNIHLMPRTVV
jgi:hypothetical protein